MDRTPEYQRQVYLKWKEKKKLRDAGLLPPVLRVQKEEKGEYRKQYIRDWRKEKGITKSHKVVGSYRFEPTPMPVVEKPVTPKLKKLKVKKKPKPKKVKVKKVATVKVPKVVVPKPKPIKIPKVKVIKEPKIRVVKPKIVKVTKPKLAKKQVIKRYRPPKEQVTIPTIKQNLDDLVRVVIDAKTVIYVKQGRDIEEVKQKYKNR